MNPMKHILLSPLVLKSFLNLTNIICTFWKRKGNHVTVRSHGSIRKTIVRSQGSIVRSRTYSVFLIYIFFIAQTCDLHIIWQQLYRLRRDSPSWEQVIPIVLFTLSFSISRCMGTSANSSSFLFQSRLGSHVALVITSEILLGRYVLGG